MSTKASHGNTNFVQPIWLMVFQLRYNIAKLAGLQTCYFGVKKRIFNPAYHLCLVLLCDLGFEFWECLKLNYLNMIFILFIVQEDIVLTLWTKYCTVTSRSSIGKVIGGFRGSWCCWRDGYPQADSSRTRAIFLFCLSALIVNLSLYLPSTLLPTIIRQSGRLHGYFSSVDKTKTIHAAARHILQIPRHILQTFLVMKRIQKWCY